MKVMGHEQLVFCQDKKTGLKAIIAIHNTKLGPALGGTRMWDYSSEEEAVIDVLRLSRGMSFKAAITGLELGGGKAVIIGDAKTQKTPELMQRFGKFVDTLNGNYITAEDVGMNEKDMEYVRLATKHVTGIPEKLGGSGDPSPVTAYGVYMGMKACAMHKWESDSLKGKKIVVQGVGHVGESLVSHLNDEGAEIFINDINLEQVTLICKKYNVNSIQSSEMFDFDMDIYSPCALGATLNPISIEKLKCSIICGAANNQLEDENRDSLLIANKAIIFAPDFLVNAGGLINVYSEIKKFSREEALSQTSKIYNTTLDILRKSQVENITSYAAALKIANQRLLSNNK
jgi:leucine dehydrogenase